MRIYRSSRIARYHPAYRGRDAAPLPPIYQVVRGYPESCECINHIALIGENPGADEDQAGFPFVGRSGEEVDRFLDAYGIEPDECFLTNIGRIYRIGNPDPTQDDIDLWEDMLKEELNVARPYWIASIGRVSTRYFLGDVNMEAVHGVPYLVVLPWLDNGRGGRVVVVPVYHPAAGFHSTELQAAIAYDFANLAATVQGRLPPRRPELADQFPDATYFDLTDAAEDLTAIAGHLDGGTPTDQLVVAIDTEGLPGNPWGLSYSAVPGTAFVIRKVHPVAMRMFYRYLSNGIADRRVHVVLHNSLHDLRVLRELGIPIPGGSFTDTMVLAYHLCIEPQGLKPLAYRHAGMEMESYDEQVSDAQDRIAVDYYETMEAMTAGGAEYTEVLPFGFDPEFDRFEDHVTKVGVSVGPFAFIQPYQLSVRDPATGKLVEKAKKPQQIDQRVKRALGELRSGKITAAQLRTRWNGTDDMVVDAVEVVIGPMREADLNDVPLPRAIRYAGRDADATRRIYPILLDRHRAMGLSRVSDIDHAIIPMVDEMQATGIRVNVEYFKRLSADLASRMLRVQHDIKARFGVWINPNSGEQVADLLFSAPEDGGYGLIATKQTKGRVDKETGNMVGRRGSTQDKVLEGLRNEHPIVPFILDYRGLTKAKTSFADVAIQKAVWERHETLDGGAEEGWFIHCNFRITRVSSGRMSATGPNLMAVVGGDLGMEIRDGYEAGDGFEFAEWDLSQIEMRQMASESGDEFLISMMLNDEDIHAGTADKMFHLGLERPYRKEQVRKRHRDPAKRTGFGVITGIQGPGLVDQMRLQGVIVSEDEANQWIVDWLAACPAVPEYMQRCHREAMAYGYVRDWTGRIRYLPGIHSPFRHIRAEAGRQSHSHKIQAGAQSIMKIGMATIHREVIPYWRERGKYIRPILQVHDSLMLRIRGFTAEEKEELDAQVKTALFSAAPPDFKVPLDAGYGSATTWGRLEH